MKKLCLVLLLTTITVHASVRDLYNLLVDATEGQNLAKTPRTQRHPGTGKKLADSIRNQADTLITQLETTERTAKSSGASKEEVEKLNEQIKTLQEQLAKMQQENKRLADLAEAYRNAMLGITQRFEALDKVIGDVEATAKEAAAGRR